MARGTRVQRRYRQPSEKKRKLLTVKIAVFFTVVALFSVLAMIIPLRPTESAVEKRELTKFPEFSFQSLTDGSYFKQIDLWFSDTFPFRDTFTSMNSHMKNLYGLHPITVHGEVTRGDAIPDKPAQPPVVSVASPSEAPSGENTSESGSSQAGSSSQETPSQSVSSQEASSESPQSQSSSQSVSEPDDKVVPTTNLGAVLLAGDSAYEYYNFNLEVADQYAVEVNNITQILQGKATVYAMVIPTSIDIMLNEATREGINTDNQKKAIDYMYASMLDATRKVNIYDTLFAHRDEYLYFRTDHHWTALGGYYAYEEFTKMKGVAPLPLSQYETVEFPNFLGSFYSDTEKNPILEQNPDTVVAYIPPDTNEITCTQTDGSILNWNIVFDVTDYSSSAKYNCFIGGDQPFSVIENPNKKDGSACVVVKESFGNAMVPFLVSHYQTVYVVDYRYWEGSISQLVDEKGIEDVILANNISATRSAALVDAMGTVLY